tara:strand:- start:544 stop:978 length:435 start_codon:yes stop_codon:yes gene_type:complete
LVKTITKIAEKVCKDLEMYTPEAIELIISTGKAESGYRALEQKKGPALGYFQIEPNTIDDVLDNYAKYRPEIMQTLVDLGLIHGDEHFSVMSNIALQVAFCRLCYRRVPEKLPPNLKGMASYWKKYYNTAKGKGTIKHFLEANK